MGTVRVESYSSTSEFIVADTILELVALRPILNSNNDCESTYGRTILILTFLERGH